jgi:RimJ/RimL family protein N-acetyltransferase
VCFSSYASSYPSKLDSFTAFIWLGFIFSISVYAIIGSLVIYFNDVRNSKSGILNLPIFIVLIGLTILTFGEIVSMYIIAPGFLGGSLVGGVIPSLIYYLIVKNIQNPKVRINDYSFHTPRLQLIKLDEFLQSNNNEVLIDKVQALLTPEVTKDLPEGWQDINTIEKAEDWLYEMQSESKFHLIQQDQAVIGFLFLYETPSDKQRIDLRIGYLLAKESWGQGIASEMIQGLLMHCKSGLNIRSILAGVNKENKASIRALEKCGFELTESESSDTLMFEYKYK